MDPQAIRSPNITRKIVALLLLSFFLRLPLAAQSPKPIQEKSRARARELGVKVGILPTGSLNAITDVPGVAVGHTTIIRGENVRTGVTAVLPHQGILFREIVPGAVVVGYVFGKLMGSTQVQEL